MGTPRDTAKPHPGTAPKTAYEYVKEQLGLSGVSFYEDGDCLRFYVGHAEWCLLDESPGMAKITVGSDSANTMGIDFKVQLARLAKLQRSRLHMEALRWDAVSEEIRKLNGINFTEKK